MSQTDTVLLEVPHTPLRGAQDGYHKADRGLTVPGGPPLYQKEADRPESNAHGHSTVVSHTLFPGNGERRKGVDVNTPTCCTPPTGPIPRLHSPGGGRAGRRADRLARTCLAREANVAREGPCVC